MALFSLNELFPSFPCSFTKNAWESEESIYEPIKFNESFDSCDEEVNRIFECSRVEEIRNEEIFFEGTSEVPELARTDNILTESGEINFTSLLTFMQDIGLPTSSEEPQWPPRSIEAVPERSFAKVEKFLPEIPEPKGCEICGQEDHIPTQEYFYQSFDEDENEDFDSHDESSEESCNESQSLNEEDNEKSFDLENFINVIRKIDILKDNEPNELFL